MRESAECKNDNPIISIYGVIFLPNFLNIKFVGSIISENIKENQMKPDPSIEGHQRKCRVQEL